MAFQGLSVPDVATYLGVHPSRVRALIAQGVLPAEKIGGRWLVDRRALEQRPTPAHGRPYSRTNAWGAVALLSDAEPKWLSNSALSKLSRRISDESVEALLPRLRTRARVQRGRVHPADVARLANEQGVVLTGVSATKHYGFDIVVSEQVEAYVSAKRFGVLAKKYRLEPSENPNVTLRVVEGMWPFESGQSIAWRSLVAIDLAESTDPRTNRAGRAILSEIVHD